MLSENLKKKIKQATNLISQAVENRDLIILRHHADCDGYCAALVIEDVILPKIQNQNIKVWQKYKRLPMKSPYYNYMDALKDIELCRNSIAAGKSPLLIMVDNGSGTADVIALKRLKQYDIRVIVIDHHIFSEEAVSIPDISINSREDGGSGNITAGILAYEVASLIGDADALYAAVAAVGDKSPEEIVQKYSSRQMDELKDIALCVDFEASHLGFMESDTIKDLFNEKQSENIQLIAPYVKGMIEEFSVIAKKHVKKEGDGIYIIDLDEVLIPGGFPTAGKATGITHRAQSGPRATLGIVSFFVCFRIEGLDFKLKEIFSRLKKEGLSVSGGGHDVAGTIKFIPADKEKVLKVIKTYVSSLF